LKRENFRDGGLRVRGRTGWGGGLLESEERKNASAGVEKRGKGRVGA